MLTDATPVDVVPLRPIHLLVRLRLFGLARFLLRVRLGLVHATTVAPRDAHVHHERVRGVRRASHVAVVAHGLRIQDSAHAPRADHSPQVIGTDGVERVRVEAVPAGAGGVRDEPARRLVLRTLARGCGVEAVLLFERVRLVGDRLDSPRRARRERHVLEVEVALAGLVAGNLLGHLLIQLRCDQPDEDRVERAHAAIEALRGVHRVRASELRHEVVTRRAEPRRSRASGRADAAHVETRLRRAARECLHGPLVGHARRVVGARFAAARLARGVIVVKVPVVA